jgi:hypothetical protein
MASNASREDAITCGNRRREVITKRSYKCMLAFYRSKCMFTMIHPILMFCFAFDFSLWGPFHVVLFNTIVFLLAMAHLKAVCSDPGVVPLPQNRVDFSDIHSGSVWLFYAVVYPLLLVQYHASENEILPNITPWTPFSVLFK